MTGKLLAPSTEVFDLFIKAQEGIRLFLDHKLVIDAWEGMCYVLGVFLFVAVAAVVKKPPATCGGDTKILTGNWPRSPRALTSSWA